MNLNDIRSTIDRIDASIAGLVSERLECAALVRRLKTKTEDSAREAEVISRARASVRGLLSPDFSEKLYTSLIDESKRVQENGARTVAFQGVHGANGEAAALAWEPECAAIQCPEFEDVFALVQEGLVDYGIVPIENTSGGMVGPVNTLMIDTSLKIVGAVDMRVSHSLLALPGTDYRELRTVYSHPQALSQCREFIARNRLDPKPFFDTAGAAKMIAEERPKASAALASPLAGKMYGLETLVENAEDIEDNRTRFAIIARDSDDTRKCGSKCGSKCSIVFAAEHTAGSLYRVLEIFAREDINLTRIESVPEKPGEYAMFIDFEGSEHDPKIARALSGLKALNPTARILGFYDEIEWISS